MYIYKSPAPNLCLGKKEARFDPRTLMFMDYFPTTSLPKVPKNKTWMTSLTGQPLGMMKNDVEGDCTIAGAGHLDMVWTSNINKGTSRIITDDQINKAYIDVTGSEGAAFDPKTGKNDNGCVMVDVLNYWRKTGIGGSNIDAYVAIEPQHIEFIEAGTYIFGGTYVGIQLPLTASDEFKPGKIGMWTAANQHTGRGKAGSWGGHCVPIVAYNALSKIFTIITWGQLWHMSYYFWLAYGDEAYACKSKDWESSSGYNPLGFNDTQLSADLAAIAA